ncbi:OLC1v1021727C1 [Oldenlandia corymbosa var. corymbosa]|uniref:OLC1v1021727C1 n=1 Tax=Oldenlandia corymbosa var. corymbosa TaxID=529605 RepID=A0AAV1BWA7_OLDCO|nr:OLC1v1021727C1 [Oldenlandia corymbosa var. corymbosa]
MAWGTNCGYCFQAGNEGYGMGLVRSSSFGRKRVSLASNGMMNIDCFEQTPLKRQCSFEASFLYSDKSPLEELPQEVLIKIICGVDHDDLKRLFFVSKSVRDATVIAKHEHFEYKTPRKTLGFSNAADMEDSGEFNEVERAPKQVRIRKSRLNFEKMSDIAVALFSPEGEDRWPRRELFMEA